MGSNTRIYLKCNEEVVEEEEEEKDNIHTRVLCSLEGEDEFQCLKVGTFS